MDSISTKENIQRSKQRKIRIIGNTLIILILLLTVELASYVALRFGILPRNPALFYVQPPKINLPIHKMYNEYLHPVVGWATEVHEERRYSIETESRPNPTFPDDSKSCVSIYGDSFTFGDEVNDDEAWGNVLSGLLDCKVANFGQSGYGTDQAYLRFELNKADKAPINVLTIYPDNILRNLNQYRPFLAGPHAAWTAAKPRFIMEGSKLKLIPQLTFTYEELLEVTKSPSRAHFPYEYFLPGTSAGLPEYSFPYSFAVARFATSKKVINFFSKKPSWIHYLDDDHPSNALQITNGIIDKFTSLATERGHRSLIVIYPTGSSYEYYKRTGVTATAPITDALDRADTNYLDLHVYFSNYLKDRSYCEILTMPDSCIGHYNPEGNRAVAMALKDRIQPTTSE